MEYLIYVLVLLFGWITGAFVNYVSDVLPIRRQLVAPICLYCEAQQGMLNYFFWPRRCQQCNITRSKRVWIIEFIYILVAIWLWQDQPAIIQLVAGLVVFAYFGIVTIIDFEHRLIMHPISFAGVVIGLVYGTINHGLLPTLIGGVAGFGIMLLLYFFGYLFSGFVTRKRGQEIGEEALGFGDVNLSGVLGLFLGWPGIIVGLIFAIVLAGIVSLAILVFSIISKRYKYNMTIAYGPYLVASAIVLLYFKDYLIL